MRVAFMGTPAFAVPVLDALIAAGHEIVGVWSQPPRPAGRGQQPRLSAVAARAREAGLVVHHPTGWRTPEALSTLAAAAPEVAVVVAYGRILPQAALDVPPLGAFNVHASLLPRWRGAAPIQRAILAGDTESGVSIMRMEAGLDTGPVLMAEAIPIGADDTAGDLHDRLSELGARLMVETLAGLDHLQVVPQPEAGVTCAAMIDKAEARIDWRRPAIEVDRLIRGLSPFPGAWCAAAGERLKLLRSRLAPGHGAPGEVLDGFRIACGEGAVEVLEAQRPGRRPLPATDVLRGRPLPARLD